MSITKAETSLNYINTTNYLESNSNIVKHLKEIFWEDINLWIENIIIKTKNKWLIKLNNIFWWSFLNSCFHPDEYGIWSYRASSLINTAEIAELIEIDNERIYIDYLDTINNAWIKWFPNIKMSSSNLITKINEIPSNNSRWLKERLRKSKEVFLEFLKISSFDKTPNNKVIEYIDEILSELEIKDSINEFIWDKENDKFDKIEKEWWKVKNRQKSIEKTKNRFTNFLLWTKIKDRLLEIKKEFKNNLLHIKYKNW